MYLLESPVPNVFFQPALLIAPYWLNNIHCFARQVRICLPTKSGWCQASHTRGERSCSVRHFHNSQHGVGWRQNSRHFWWRYYAHTVDELIKISKFIVRLPWRSFLWYIFIYSVDEDKTQDVELYICNFKWGTTLVCIYTCLVNEYMYIKYFVKLHQAAHIHDLQSYMTCCCCGWTVWSANTSGAVWFQVATTGWRQPQWGRMVSNHSTYIIHYRLSPAGHWSVWSFTVNWKVSGVEISSSAANWVRCFYQLV